jgi:hypothetical protein
MEEDLLLNEFQECYATIWKDFMDLFHSLDPTHFIVIVSLALLTLLFFISFIFYFIFFSHSKQNQDSATTKNPSVVQESVSSSPQTPNRKSNAGLETFASAQVMVSLPPR